MSITISAYKRCSVRLYLQLFEGGLMSYLLYLCLFAHGGAQHLLCNVFVLFVFALCVLCCIINCTVHVIYFSCSDALSCITLLKRDTKVHFK
jgi:hypothetical protein